MKKIRERAIEIEAENASSLDCSDFDELVCLDHAPKAAILASQRDRDWAAGHEGNSEDDPSRCQGETRRVRLSAHRAL